MKLRHAKRSQCPNCNTKWALDILLGDIWRCKSCGYSPTIGKFLIEVNGKYQAKEKRSQ